jgi:hypothetical protein
MSSGRGVETRVVDGGDGECTRTSADSRHTTRGARRWTIDTCTVRNVAPPSLNWQRLLRHYGIHGAALGGQYESYLVARASRFAVIRDAAAVQVRQRVWECVE